ncbi:hypothetical protein BGZ98_005320 [Dissophora globulifera]|nr:hypothetical protein BGZ98_005320 [Dissophora globulifera]
MTRPEPDSDSKVSRSYSLASAPLRLLSHSFHSTASTFYSTLASSGATSAQQFTNHIDIHQKDASALDATSPPALHHVPDFLTAHAALPSITLKQKLAIQPSLTSHSTLYHPQQEYSVQPHQTLQDCPQQNTNTAAVLPQLSGQPEADFNRFLGSSGKAIRLTSSTSMGSAITIASAKAGEIERPVSMQRARDQETASGAARLENLLLPYDIRYSIFGHLSLQDIYHCQLTCKLLCWATSDQSIWKRIALNLIQGEFYFDIPNTLPANIPNWRFFCKRHFLRQRNWRQGHVQDVISLDDNCQKLTTLQIMAPYVLTGCDDGRVHLWNISTKTLLHRFQIRGEITWVEHLQEQKMVAGLGYDIENMESEIRLFSTETGEEIGFYKEDFWDLAICAINETYLVASDAEGRYTTWDWRSGTKVSQFKVEDETSFTEALHLVQNTILELHYDGIIRLFSIYGECFGRLTLDNILPNHQVSFCWLHNDFSMVVWESSNTMAHIRLPLLIQDVHDGRGHQHRSLNRHISQAEWDAQGAEIYWRHQLEHTCNFAAMGGGRFQMLYVQIFENLTNQVPIHVHSLRHNGPATPGSGIDTGTSAGAGVGPGTSVELNRGAEATEKDDGYGWQHGEFVRAHSLDPDLEKIIQGLRPSRIDCDPEYIVVGLVQGGIRLLQFAPVDEKLLERTSSFAEGLQ